MKIGLNLLYMDQQCGAWTYIDRVLKSLAAVNSDHLFYAYVHDGCASVVPSSPNFEVRRVCSGVPSRFRRVFLEHQVVPRLAVSDGVQILHWFGNVASQFRLVRSVVTVYDLKPFDHPPRSLRDLYMRVAMPGSAKKATHVMPMSEFTARSIAERFHIPAANMTVLPCPIQPEFERVPSGAQDEFRARYGLPCQFWVYVAHFYSHKNHLRLLEAFAAYCREFGQNAWSLALRGNDYGEYSKVRERATALGLTDRLIWLPFIPESEMPALYSSATALIFPSEYEGTGIPILEAMSCGCPVVASDLAPVEEFAAGSAITFDPTSVPDIFQAMCRAHSDDLLRRDLAQHGLGRVSGLRPVVVGQKLLDTYAIVGSGDGAHHEPSLLCE